MYNQVDIIRYEKQRMYINYTREEPMELIKIIRNKHPNTTMTNGQSLRTR